MQTLGLLKTGLIVVRYLPHPVLCALCYLFATLAFVLRPTERQIIQANQRQVLGAVSPLRLHWQSWRVLVNVFRNYYALLRLFHCPDEEITRLVELRGWEHLDAALRAGRGVVVLGAHIGNYNLLAPFMALCGPPAGAFVEPVEPPELFAFVSQVRARTGLRLFNADRDGVRGAVRLLRDNGILAVTGDRYLGNNGAVAAFFGRRTCLPQGAVVLAQRCGAPLLPASLRSLPGNRLRVELGPPLPLVETRQPRHDLAVNMRLVAGALERAISAVPEQWVMLNYAWLDDVPAVQTTTPAAATSPAHRLTLRRLVNLIVCFALLSALWQWFANGRNRRQD